MKQKPLVIVVFTYTFLSSITSCPPELFSKLFHCMGELIPMQLDLTDIESAVEGVVPVLGNADPDTVEKQCREGKYHDAVQCIEDTIQICHENSLGMFKEIFDARKLRTMIGYYCNNTATYRAASPCMTKNSKAIQYCVIKELEMQKNAVTRTASTTHIDELCRAKGMGQECVNQILKEECGDDIADLLQKTADAPLSAKCKAASTGETFEVPVEYKSTKNTKDSKNNKHSKNDKTGKGKGGRRKHNRKGKNKGRNRSTTSPAVIDITTESNNVYRLDNGVQNAYSTSSSIQYSTIIFLFICFLALHNIWHISSFTSVLS